MLPKPLPWLLILLIIRHSSAIDSFNDDVLALIVFKSALADPLSKLASWTDSDDTPCKWAFVTCSDDTNRVTELTLPGLSLSGEVSRGVLRLQFLQRLDLSNNSFSGEIPPGLSGLWSLQFIDFSANGFSGEIPGEIFRQCGSLKSASFAGNLLSGELPESLGSCMSLESVDFSSNQLTGKLSPNLFSLSGLKSLDLSNNLLEGQVPVGFGKMYSLVALNLEKNSFSGVLPGDIGDCPKLETLNLGKNLFSGGIPESLKQLKDCTFLSLRSNLLEGEVPNWIGQLTSLENLDLSSNRFSGKIPESLGNLAESLTSLNLSSNGFIGTLPKSLNSCSSLVSVDFSKNLLDGDFPNWVFDLGLHSISLSVNKFSGRIWFRVETDYHKMEVLDLSSNRISGLIPSEIEDFDNLLVLNLSSNLLTGPIPPAIAKSKMIQIIDLSNNRLNGSIPGEIREAVSMRELRLQNNVLTGFIPDQIGNCSALTTLILNRNNLTGEIPTTLANIKNLRITDLSHNNLTGTLPKELTNLSQLESFNISHNRLEGELPDSTFFNAIPLSSVSSNPSLCGSVLNKTCPSIHPKPIVLNPNPSASSSDTVPQTLHKKKLMLSISSLVAIGAATFILLGVVAITILNFRVTRFSSERELAFSIKDELSQSRESESEYGKLVMFSGEVDFGEGAHSLLTKDREIGHGGFGTVYHTTIPCGTSFAIKKLSISSLIKSQDEFEREVSKLGKARHPNVVCLEGYYWTSSLQLLINEYVSGQTLFTILHDDPTDESIPPLSWQQRFKIVKGIAKGLAHLHQMGITHYNLKSTNILLDSSHEPKVGDFGLARLIPMLDRYILSSKIQSALGYMAPEFACQSVKITEKCDVYGFGILVLEIMTGRRPVEYMEDDVVVLCDMVRECLEEGRVEDCVDRGVLGNGVCVEDVERVVKLGLVCASQVPSSRPDMGEVVSVLEQISGS